MGGYIHSSSWSLFNWSHLFRHAPTPAVEKALQVWSLGKRSRLEMEILETSTDGVQLSL